MPLPDKERLRYIAEDAPGEVTLAEIRAIAQYV